MLAMPFCYAASGKEIPVQPLQSYLDDLVRQAHSEGGWGYAPDQAAHLEPTCLGLLALSLAADTYAGPIAKAKAVLQQHAGPDGGFRLERGRPEAVWPSALALF